ncbi:MAG: YjbQ family protein [Planctomycetota bacterium]|nr:MAG: YjbQ family protein [Planctomycetota bacterium]
MKVEWYTINRETQGYTDIIDITKAVEENIQKGELRFGVVNLMVIGSTASLSTIEFEPGLVQDLKEVLEKLAPYDFPYHHHDRWHDDNGASHIRATLLGPSLSLPFQNKKLLLGTWQQIILIDFDTRPRSREIICQIMGK